MDDRVVCLEVVPILRCSELSRQESIGLGGLPFVHLNEIGVFHFLVLEVFLSDLGAVFVSLVFDP